MYPSTISISIIVPVYNAERYLQCCINSLITQTFKNIEIIIINDGSTDNSANICNYFAQKDERIKVIHQMNLGLSSARNNGISVAKGKYILFVDADDWLEANSLEIIYNSAEKSGADLVMFSYLREYKLNTLKKNIDLNEGFYDADLTRKYLLRRIIGLTNDELKNPENIDSLSTASCKLYKRQCIKDLRFIDTQIIGTEDLFFNILAVNQIRSALFINKPFYHYRKYSENSLTNKYKPDLYIKWNNLFNMIKNFIEINNLGNDFITAFNNRISLSIIGLGLNEISTLNKKNMFEKIKYLNCILRQPLFCNAYKNLEIKFFKIHWMIFFLCCKLRFGFGLYLLLKLINFFRKKV